MAQIPAGTRPVPRQLTFVLSWDLGFGGAKERSIYLSSSSSSSLRVLRREGFDGRRESESWGLVWIGFSLSAMLLLSWRCRSRSVVSDWLRYVCV